MSQQQTQVYFAPKLDRFLVKLILHGKAEQEIIFLRFMYAPALL
jgi:hypothetical protein